MKNNVIDCFKNVGNVILVERRGIFRGKAINNSRVGFYKLHVSGKFFKTLKRLFNALAVAEVMAAFRKTPEEIRIEAIKQERLQQEDAIREISC
ncbi:MAG: hypothetical protein LBC11_00585 [Puniceicoccales bacterium]|jgi:hypothetical protein|nr:hypothetical protein [Puniceicoccales bacterium]